MKPFDSLIGSAARAAMDEDRRIRGVISRIVPAEALAHVMFCRLRDRQLRVTLDSAAWIPRLRFSERQLLAALARDGLEARTVSWHVTPLKRPAPRETRRRDANAGSAQAARAMLSAARDVDDEVLSEQLRRVARRLTGRSVEGHEPRGSSEQGDDRTDGVSDKTPDERGP